MLRALLVSALLFVACSGPVDGKVTEKKHEPQDMTLVPIITPHTVCSGGKTTICTTFTTVTLLPVNDTEDWVLVVVTEADEHRVEVSKEVWDQTQVGDWYSSGEQRAE